MARRKSDRGPAECATRTAKKSLFYNYPPAGVAKFAAIFLPCLSDG